MSRRIRKIPKVYEQKNNMKNKNITEEDIVNNINYSSKYEKIMYP